MKQALGFIEYKSIARGLMAADVMLKSGHVELILSQVLCPGKFIALVSGDVGAVQAAVENGYKFDSHFAISKFILPNPHPSVLLALMAVTVTDIKGSLGIIETVDASSAVVAGDIAAKAANINLLEIRLARGMGGKAFVFLCGDLTGVETAVNAASTYLVDEGVLIATSVIPSPHPKLRF
ncbi:MAG: BMC domain-containing protein [Dehalobacterium sp.]